MHTRARSSLRSRRFAGAVRAQMALLITLTIAFSFLTALGPFLALCAAAGPEGRVGNIADMFGAVRQCLCRRPTSKSLHE